MSKRKAEEDIETLEKITPLGPQPRSQVQSPVLAFQRLAAAASNSSSSSESDAEEGGNPQIHLSFPSSAQGDGGVEEEEGAANAEEGGNASDSGSSQSPGALAYSPFASHPSNSQAREENYSPNPADSRSPESINTVGNSSDSDS